MSSPPIANQPVQYYNRYSREIETEQIYGESWLRWAYGRPMGRWVTRWLASRPWFSHWYGWRMEQPKSARLIQPFIRKYGLDEKEWEWPADAYPHFQAFFCRRLRKEVRPLAEGEGVISLPADGRHLGFPEVGREEGIYIKGQRWSLSQLLGSEEEAEAFEGGTLVVSRLCPVDYHHFHFVLDGVPGQAQTLPGPLFSVNPIALRRDAGILFRNKRMLTPVIHANLGRFFQIEVGATNVGTIFQGFTPGKPVERGLWKGGFKFGGSSTLTLFPAGKVRLADDLVANTQRQLETYAHFGDVLGWITK